MKVREDKMKDFEELSLELTDCCPLDCLHCSSNSGPFCSNCLPNNLVKSLIDEASQMGVRKISLGGGEPVIANNFFSVLSYISEKDIRAEVFTSGIVSSHNNVEGYSDEFIEAISKYSNLTVIFSLYGSTPEIHDCVTQTPGSFTAACHSLKECLVSGVKCEVNYVPLRINAGCFENLIDMVKSLGMSKISVLRFVPQGRGHQNRNILEISELEEDSFVAKILQLRKESNFQIRTGSPFNGIVPGNKVPCRAGFAKLVIQANGNVLPCEVFKHHKRRNWDLSVYKHSLSDILESKQITALRNRLDKSNCLECPIHFSLRRRICEGAISV